MLSGPSKESLPLPFLSYLSFFVVYFPNSLQFVYWSCTSPWTWSLPIPSFYYQFPVSALCAGIIGSCRSSTVLCGFQIPHSRPHICPSDLSAALSSQSLAVISTWICYQTLDNYMWITEASIAFLWCLWVSPNLYMQTVICKWKPVCWIWCGFPDFQKISMHLFYLVAIKYPNWAVDSLTSVLKLCIII